VSKSRAVPCYRRGAVREALLRGAYAGVRRLSCAWRGPAKAAESSRPVERAQAEVPFAKLSRRLDDQADHSEAIRAVRRRVRLSGHAASELRKFCSIECAWLGRNRPAHWSPPRSVPMPDTPS
jgi:hypothetical protein